MLPGNGKKFDRRFPAAQQLAVILRHIGGFYVGAGKKLAGNLPEQGGFTRSVAADNADSFRPRHVQGDAARQHAPAGFQRVPSEIQHGFAAGDGSVFPELNQDCVLRIGKFRHGFLLPLKTAAHGFYRFHFALNHFAAVRIAARNVRLPVFYAGLEPAEPFLLLLVLAFFLVRQLLLPFKEAEPFLYILPVAHPRDGAARHGFAAELFQVDNHVGGVFQERFVMGDIQRGNPAGVQECFQPLERFQVEVVGRFVQQQKIRFPRKDERKLKLDFFSAGKCPGRPPGAQKAGTQPKPPRRRGQAGAVRARGKPENRRFLLLFGQFLRQISGAQSVFDDSAGILRVAFHQRGVGDPF